MMCFFSMLSRNCLGEKFISRRPPPGWSGQYLGPTLDMCTCVISLHSPYKLGGPERFRNMPKVTQLLRVGAGPRIRTVWLQRWCFELSSGTITLPSMWLWAVYTVSVRVSSRTVLLNPCELEKERGAALQRQGM